MPDNLSEKFQLLPFGGLGEIGMNMLGIEYAGKILLIDCGLMFPEANMFGIVSTKMVLKPMNGRL